MASDRPLRRSLVKLGARMLFGRRRAHAQDWLPSLSLEGSGRWQTVVYRGSTVAALLPPETLAAAVQDRIYIVGSGPSTGACDLGRVEDGTAILLNGAMALIGSDVARPLAVAVEDERFVYRHFERFMRALDKGIPCLFSVAALRAICEIDSGWLGERTVVLIDNIAKPYGGDARSMAQLAALDWVKVDGKGAAGFSLDPEQGVFQGGSVAVSALQFAFSCRPSSIGFLGIDISNAAGPRFYENDERTAFSGVAAAESRILAHFALARELADQNGIELVNFSPVSALSKCGIAYSDRFTANR